MSNLIKTGSLTLIYWIAAVTLAILTPRGDWIDLRWPVSIYCFAIPMTILLWVFYLITRYSRFIFSKKAFALIGIALPFVYIAIAWGGGRWVNKHRHQRLANQLSAASLDTISDEPLQLAEGPIGVRLRYRVSYPKGLDMDEAHGTFAMIGMERMFNGFTTLRRTIVPHVSKAFPPGSYELTEDFLPSFLPFFLIDPKISSNSYGKCFRWNSTMSSQDILRGEAQTLVIAVFLSNVPLRMTTENRYRLADFYITAVKRGAVDCPEKAGGG